jgi:hypothetical protein
MDHLAGFRASPKGDLDFGSCARTRTSASVHFFSHFNDVSCYDTGYTESNDVAGWWTSAFERREMLMAHLKAKCWNLSGRIK